MNVEKIWADLQTLPGFILKINKRDKQAVALLNKLSRELYGESVVAGCTNCHIKAYHKLTSITLQKLIEMSEKKFILKKGIAVEYPVRGGRHFSFETITDDIARELLINSPSAIKFFDGYPTLEDGTVDLGLPVVVAKAVVKVEAAPEAEAEETPAPKQTHNKSKKRR